MSEDPADPPVSILQRIAVAVLLIVIGAFAVFGAMQIGDQIVDIWVTASMWWSSL